MNIFFSQKTGRMNYSRRVLLRGFDTEKKDFSARFKNFAAFIRPVCSLADMNEIFANLRVSFKTKKMEQWKPPRLVIALGPVDPKGKRLPRPSHWHCERLMLTRLSSVNANHKSRSSSCCAEKIRVSKLQSLSTAKYLCNRQIKFFGEFFPCRRRWFYPGEVEKDGRLFGFRKLTVYATTLRLGHRGYRVKCCATFEAVCIIKWLNWIKKL